MELYAKPVGARDVAVINKDLDGKVHVRKHENATQQGASSPHAPHPFRSTRAVVKGHTFSLLLGVLRWPRCLPVLLRESPDWDSGLLADAGMVDRQKSGQGNPARARRAIHLEQRIGARG